MAKIALERFYPHPPESVWRAISERDALARWLMPNDFEAVVGHHFTFTTDPAPGFDGIVHCEVLELDPPRKLVFSWRGGPIDTVVTFELSESEGGTRFRMMQDGFRGFRAWLVSKMLGSGCREIYGKRLPEFLDEQHRRAAPDVEARVCMNPWTRFLAWLSTRFTPGRRRS